MKDASTVFPIGNLKKYGKGVLIHAIGHNASLGYLPLQMASLNTSTHIMFHHCKGNIYKQNLYELSHDNPSFVPW